MSRMRDPELRRVWRKRIIDHDGESAENGGIERWYKLTDGLGLDREYVKSTEGILSTTAGVLGTLQANEVIKTILNADKDLAGNMLIFRGENSAEIST